MKLNDHNINNPISFDLKDEYENYNLSNYISCNNPYESRITSDKENEDALKSDYSGRELYEIIQNADDQRASSIEIELDTENRLHVRNNGGYPFSNKGLLSVLRPHQSSKERSNSIDGATIGNKGLGIRSLLNWSDGMTIHSNGVKVEFSKSITEDKWTHILEQTRNSLKGLEKEGKCPLAILSVPEVTQDDVTSPNDKGKWTTEIEILCHTEVLNDVKSKMQELQAEVLLFLKHIRNIALIIHGEKNSLMRRDTEPKPTDGESSTELEARDQIYRYVVYRETETIPNSSDKNKHEEFEVVVAYSTNTERYCDYLYSYFPTRIPLKLPCVLHANFHLTISRDGLVQDRQNVRIMEHLGELLVRAAEKRAATMTNETHRLLPMKMLFLEEATKTTMPKFADAVDKTLDTCKIIPTIDGKFKSLKEGVYFSQGVVLNEFLSEIEPKSLLNNYLDSDTFEYLFQHSKPIQGINILYKDLSVLAEKLDTETLGKLIIYLLRVDNWQIKPNVLRLDNGKIANSTESVYVLESRDVSTADGQAESGNAAPVELKLNILSPLLAKYLQKELNADSRGITQKLKKIAEVSDADFSRIKQEIENKSAEMSKEELKGILSWLFQRCDGDNDTPPECYKFKLRNALDEPKPVCSLLLECDKKEYKLDEYLQEAIPANLREKFFIEYLQCAAALPVETIDFIKEEKYVDMVVSDKDKLRYIKNNNQLKNKALIPIADFIQDKSKEDIVNLILNDLRFSKELKDNNHIDYFHYNVNTYTTPFGYATYWLSKRPNAPLADIGNYVIPIGMAFETSILNADLLDLSKINNTDKADLYQLLEVLGAKKNPLDLSYAQLYQLLEKQKSSEKIQSVYKEIRSLIIKKKDIQKEEPTDSDKTILKSVWAKGPNGKCERRPKEEVYYWDNSKLPEKFLASLWKLCLGSRIGEKSVHEIFGVKLLSDINLHILNPDAYNQTLTQQVRKILEIRYQSLVATSLTIGDYKIETIKDKASKILNFLSSFRISSSITYETNGEKFEASEGDVVSDNGNFYICSSLSSINDSIDDPQLCSNLAKGLCIKLLIDAENEIRFKHIIQSSEKTIDFEWNELDETLRNDITKTIGISDEEKNFWSALGIQLDDTDCDLERRRVKIIKQIKDIVLPAKLTDIKDLQNRDLYYLLSSLSKEQRGQLNGLYSLKDYYRDQLNGEIEDLYKAYQCLSFAETCEKLKIEHNIETVREWQKTLVIFDTSIKKYAQTEFIIRDDFEDFESLQKRFRNAIKNKYNQLNQDTKEEEPHILPQYEKILNANNVSASELPHEQLALAYFAGFDSEFEEIVKQKMPLHSETIKSDLLDGVEKITFLKPCREAYRGVGKGGFTNSQTKDHIGKSAEKRVMEYLKSMPNKYESLIDVSARHEHHCDIMYKRVGDPTQRYLEIKSVNGRKIYFSFGEFEKGKSNPDTYDLALVYGDKIKIISNAFKENGELLKNIIPASYEIHVDFSDDNHSNETERCPSC